MLLPQGADAIIAVLGILKAGLAYVPLHPEDPPATLQRCIADCGARCIVTNDGYRGLGTKLVSSDKVLLVDDLDESFDEMQMRTRCVLPDEPAYIYYTSGSTGQPKGVVDSHRNVLHNIMRYTNSLRISADDRLTLLQSMSFSGSVSSLFCALLNGATVYPIDPSACTPLALARWLVDNRITIYHSVPLLFRRIATAGEKFPDIRLVRLEGDRSTSTDIEVFRAHFGPDSVLVNGFGTTETGLVTQHFVSRKTPVDVVIPLGNAVTDMEVTIVDEDRVPLTDGTSGEIAVRSHYLATGYLNQAELTANRFVNNPKTPGLRSYFTGDLGRKRTDGTLEFLSRSGRRVKIRGATVELGDVEAALLAQPIIRDAAVVVSKSGTDDERLIAFCTSNQTTTEQRLRLSIAKSLPAPAMPSRILFVDSLPETKNGKVDVSRIEDQLYQRPPLDAAYTPARSLLQLELIKIWEQVLCIKPIGINDAFLDLGGDSLRAMEMRMLVEDALNIELSPTALMSASTIAELADAIPRESPHLVELKAGKGTPLFYFHGDYHSGGIYCRKLVSALSTAMPFVAVNPVMPKPESAAASIREMAEQHADEILKFRQQGPYFVGGTCAGGLVAFETARALREQGHVVLPIVLFAASAAGTRFRTLQQFTSRFLGFVPTTKPFSARVVRLSRRLHEELQQRDGVRSRAALVLRSAFRVGRRFFSRRDARARFSDQHRMARYFLDLEYEYAPLRFDGNVFLLWPNDEAEPIETATADWQRAANTVSTIPLDATHHDCLTRDVKKLAMALDSIYQQIMSEEITRE